MEGPGSRALIVDLQVYMNYNCTILDGNTVTFGDNVLLAPFVQIYAATHSVDVVERKAGWQRAYEVEIGNDVSPLSPVHILSVY